MSFQGEKVDLSFLVAFPHFDSPGSEVECAFVGDFLFGVAAGPDFDAQGGGASESRFVAKPGSNVRR